MEFEVLIPRDLNLEYDVEETETTFEGNAKLKSEYLFKLTGINSLADDSGLCVNALDGAPGVYSARYGSSDMDDKGRAEFLLGNMENQIDRTCYFFCCISYTTKSSTHIFNGRVDGELTHDYDDTGSKFGYDPVFYYPPFQKRFSQLTPAEKNLVSHRGKALAEFVQFIKTNPELF